MRFQILIPALALVLSPLTAVAQESLNATELEQPSAGQAATNLPTEADTPSVVEALRPSSASAALLVAPPAANLPTGGDLFEAQRPDDDYTPAALVAPAKGSGTGLGFMIPKASRTTPTSSSSPSSEKRRGRERANLHLAMGQLNLLRPAVRHQCQRLDRRVQRRQSQLNAEWDEIDRSWSHSRCRSSARRETTISRTRSRRRYGTRARRTHYHFVYKNVLFVVLDSEDTPRAAPEGIKEKLDL